MGNGQLKPLPQPGPETGQVSQAQTTAIMEVDGDAHPFAGLGTDQVSVDTSIESSGPGNGCPNGEVRTPSST